MNKIDWNKVNIVEIAMPEYVYIWLRTQQCVSTILVPRFYGWDIPYELITQKRKDFEKEFWLDQYKLLLRNIIWTSKVKISLEDFMDKDLDGIRNNFYLFFFPNFIWDMYRSQNIYKRFAEENPELNEKLFRVHENNNLSVTKEESCLNLLYDAYLIMRQYPEVMTNYDLFK